MPLNWVIVATLITAAGACTYFEIRSEHHSVPTVLANTMEWGEPVSAKDWEVRVYPAGEVSHPVCPGGHAWTTVHAYVGMSNLDLFNGTAQTINAMNEHGLAVSGHAFRGGAAYDPQNATAVVCESQVGQWVLSQCKVHTRQSRLAD